jgi:hypothetical protein
LTEPYPTNAKIDKASHITYLLTEYLDNAAFCQEHGFFQARTKTKNEILATSRQPTKDLHDLQQAISKLTSSVKTFNLTGLSQMVYYNQHFLKATLPQAETHFANKKIAPQTSPSARITPHKKSVFDTEYEDSFQYTEALMKVSKSQQNLPHHLGTAINSSSNVTQTNSNEESQKSQNSTDVDTAIANYLSPNKKTPVQPHPDSYKITKDNLQAICDLVNTAIYRTRLYILE